MQIVWQRIKRVFRHCVFQGCRHEVSRVNPDFFESVSKWRQQIAFCKIGHHGRMHHRHVRNIASRISCRQLVIKGTPLGGLGDDLGANLIFGIELVGEHSDDATFAIGFADICDGAIFGLAIAKKPQEVDIGCGCSAGKTAGECRRQCHAGQKLEVLHCILLVDACCYAGRKAEVRCPGYCPYFPAPMATPATMKR